MAGTEFSVLDSAELRPFHRKVTLLSAAGMFLDGYDLAVIAVALPVLRKQWASPRRGRACWPRPPSSACWSARWSSGG